MWFHLYPCSTFILTSLISVTITEENGTSTSTVKYDPLYSEVLKNITQVNKDLRELITFYEAKFKKEKTKVLPENKHDKVINELLSKLNVIMEERPQDIIPNYGNNKSKKVKNKSGSSSDDTSYDYSLIDSDSEVIIIANGDKNNLDRLNAKTRRESQAMRESLSKLLKQAQAQKGDAWFDFMETGLKKLENNDVSEENVSSTDGNDSSVGNDSVNIIDSAVGENTNVGNDSVIGNVSAVGQDTVVRDGNKNEQKDTKVIANVSNSEESIKLEEDESKMLRTAYAEACAKVIVRKCYKAVTRSLNFVCDKKKCKKGFKNYFKTTAKTGCLESFEAGNDTNKIKEIKPEDNIQIYPLIGSPPIPFSEDFYITCFPSSKLRAAIDAVAITQNNTRETNTTLRTNKKPSKLTKETIEFTNKIQSLRTNLEELCQKVSVNKCYTACIFAATSTCNESKKKCTKSRKKSFKKSCKKQCKSSFMGADDSDTDSDDDDEDSDDEDDDE